MMHDKRVFLVTEVSSVEELADKLTNYTWTCCTGWRLGKLLFLNDATCADGAQEYAVILDGAEQFQIESITFSWCKPPEAIQHIRQCIEYAEGRAEPPMRWPIKIRTGHGKKCYLCE